MPNELRKAAVLVASLPPDYAARLLARLNREERHVLAQSIAESGAVELAEQESVLAEFTSSEQATVWLSKKGRMSPFLAGVSPSALAACLAEESPQTVAVVVAHLAPDLAAAFLAEISAERRAEVARRLATLSAIDREILVELETTLRRQLDSAVGHEKVRLGGAARLAEILRAGDQAMCGAILTAVERRDDRLAREIRRWIFIYEDLASRGVSKSANAA